MGISVKDVPWCLSVRHKTALSKSPCKSWCHTNRINPLLHSLWDQGSSSVQYTPTAPLGPTPHPVYGYLPSLNPTCFLPFGMGILRGIWSPGGISPRIAISAQSFLLGMPASILSEIHRHCTPSLHLLPIAFPYSLQSFVRGFPSISH